MGITFNKRAAGGRPFVYDEVYFAPKPNILRCFAAPIKKPKIKAEKFKLEIL